MFAFITFVFLFLPSLFSPPALYTNTSHSSILDSGCSQTLSKQIKNNSSVVSHFSPKRMSSPKQRLSGQLILIVFPFLLRGGGARAPRVCTALPRGPCHRGSTLWCCWLHTTPRVCRRASVCAYKTPTQTHTDGAVDRLHYTLLCHKKNNKIKGARSHLGLHDADLLSQKHRFTCDWRDNQTRDLLIWLWDVTDIILG